MAAEGMLSVVCGCGRRLKAPIEAAGKRARCPACGNIVVLTPPDELTATPEITPPLPPPLPVQGCPQCGAAMDESAVFCINCGYDKRTGQSLAAAPAAAALPPSAGRMPAKKPLDYMAP